MTALLVFGGDSLVGSHFVQSTRHRLTAAGRRDPRLSGLVVTEFQPIDVIDPPSVERLVRESDAEVVVNFAAQTDVDGVERERPQTTEAAAGAAFQVNAAAPEAMAKAARDAGKFLISLSTDFVFDGTSGPYAEDAGLSPLSSKMSWYGWTKAEGERRVRLVDPRAAILRLSYPYRSSFPPKLDFARRIVVGHRRRQLPPYFSDQTITPTWIPDASRALEHLIRTRAAGTFHVASPESTTPFQFARDMLSKLDGSPAELKEGSMEEFLKRPGATPRPLHGGLTCRRILAEGVPLTPWREGIRHFLAEGGGG